MFSPMNLFNILSLTCIAFKLIRKKHLQYEITHFKSHAVEIIC
jgi:hypothetical protein